MQPDAVQRRNERFECRFILIGARKTRRVPDPVRGGITLSGHGSAVGSGEMRRSGQWPRTAARSGAVGALFGCGQEVHVPGLSILDRHVVVDPELGEQIAQLAVGIGGDPVDRIADDCCRILQELDALLHAGIGQRDAGNGLRRGG